ncbi:helix-turn-helix transcriptional regulator [Bacillus paralicheniformis]|uniref:helix-turn-helix domain-containing protein n=1 Tax=Bacillus paralicheniformis TaxID=1648923 RepID=UPI003D1DA43A
MFRENLKKEREDRQFTQDEMANMIGVSTKEYVQYELGVILPDYRTIRSISDKFNISVDDLLKGEEEEVKNEIYSKKATRLLEDPDTMITIKHKELDFSTAHKMLVSHLRLNRV